MKTTKLQLNSEEIEQLVERYCENKKVLRLSDRYFTAFEPRHGLADGEVLTLAAIGRRLGVCRERARQMVGRVKEELDILESVKGLVIL